MHAVRRGCVMPARTSMTRHTTVDYVLVTSLMLSMSCLQPRPTKRTRSPDHLSCSAPRFSSKPLPPSSPGLYALLCMLSNALRNERNEVALPIVGLGRSRGSDGARDGERLSSVNRARCGRSGCAELCESRWVSLRRVYWTDGTSVLRGVSRCSPRSRARKYLYLSDTEHG